MADKLKPIGVTLGWDLRPTLKFEDGRILWGGSDRLLYPEYWPDGAEWPVDPDTGEKFKIDPR